MVQLAGDRHRAAGTRGDDVLVHEPLVRAPALEQPGPRLDPGADRHQALVRPRSTDSPEWSASSPSGCTETSKYW